MDHAHAIDTPGPPIRCLTIDVEEYFHIEAARGSIGRRDWGAWPTRVHAQMDGLLALFDEHHIRATLFFLGAVALRAPTLVKRCCDAGHEVASHGMWHDRLHRLDPPTFHAELTQSKALLEDLTGQSVRGYRAPSWSLTRQTAWAIDILLDAGYEYDASVFPVYHPSYGVCDAPLSPFWLGGSRGASRLLEVPPLVFEGWGDQRVGVAGGAYFRVLPSWLLRTGLRQAADTGRPAVLYFHPWEFDAGIPKMPIGWVNQKRTYTGLTSASSRLSRLLAEFDAGWTTMRDAVPAFRAAADAGRVVALAEPTRLRLAA